MPATWCATPGARSWWCAIPSDRHCAKGRLSPDRVFVVKSYRRWAMRDIVRFSVGAGLAAALFAAAIGGAQARSQYDGTWTVSITTTKGACDSGATFTI